jgi:Resolvase, N terminal domain
MPRQKYHRNRVYQIVGEPGPGSIAVGYVRYSSELPYPIVIAPQRRRIQEFAEKKGWEIICLYEEYKEIEQRPTFAQLLGDAGVQFRVVICSTSGQSARNIAVAYDSSAHLRRLGYWRATTDGSWHIDRSERESRQAYCRLKVPRPSQQRISRKGVH